MVFVFLKDPSFWILVSFLLLFGSLSSRVLKGLNQQLKTRQEAIARHISEVNSLYDDAKILFLEEKKNLERKKQEALLLKEETLKDIDRKKETLKSNIKDLHQKYENDIHLKMEKIHQKYVTEITKKILKESCAQAERDLEKVLDSKMKSSLIKNKIEKINFIENR